jgi:two-component system, NarL family, sensor kinase
VVLDVDGACKLPSAVEAELYRVAEQALTNVRRHARAHEVAVSLRRTRRGVKLEIADDGAGFDPRRVPAGRHGIRGMRERARLAGGTLRIASRRGAGTRVVVSV